LNVRASEVLDRWGYRDSLGVKHRLRGVFSQALLRNRSPRLDDLDAAAFAALRAHPATDGHQGSMLYARQRVVAALGYCGPPVRTGYNHAPDIDGADPAWTAWIERWHGTSTLTPKVRATIRIIMAKTGRWLAVEHPEITEPGQWTRATCAAWVRRGRPNERRRLGSASRRARRPCRRTNLAAGACGSDHGRAPARASTRRVSSAWAREPVRHAAS
jgi:hypothetical protein